MNALRLFLAVLAAAMTGPVVELRGAETHHRSDIQIRDPYILPVAESQTYFMYCAMSVRLEDDQTRQGVGVYTSKDLQRWNGPKPVFHFPDGFWADQSVWAPEVHRYQGKYYLFATFTSKDKLPTPPGDEQYVKRATQILVAETPEGPFKPFANEPHTPGNWMSLDGTFWVEDGVPYMVFCHEWVQVKDGTMELMPLKADLSGAAGTPRTLFRASDARWARGLNANGGYVTDGPFLYRSRSDRLLMIWSSFGKDRKYTVGIAWSASGKITGPWRQLDDPLLAIDGGHGMIFRTFDGRLVMPIHQPNRGNIRARLFELEDQGDELRIKQEISLHDPLADWEMGPFVKRSSPVLSPTPDSTFRCPVLGKEVRWEEQNVYNPAAVVRDGKVFLFYRADDRNPALKWGRTCRIGMAWSADGVHFTRHPTPVLYPDNDDWKPHEWEGGCEDLHIVEGENGLYCLNYTTWSGREDTMSVATSRDLIHWTKHGPAFRKTAPEKVAGSRTGVVVSRREGDRLLATRIDGKYWMYYTHPCALAWSDNLIDWTPAGKSVWPGGGREAGAIALQREDGILLMTQGGHPSLGAWTLRQTLLDWGDLTTVLKDQSEPFFYPEHNWEKEGFTGATTVANALVPFKGNWLLYYGAADRYIGLAVFDPKTDTPASTPLKK